VESLSKSALTFLGSALYLCEGTKARVSGNGHKIFAVEFTNKDERAVLIFLKFLREVIGADELRIKAELFIYPDHNEQNLVNYWSELTGISRNRFNKTILLKQKNIKFKPNPIGTLKVRYSHKEHFLKIQDIIDGIFGRPNVNY